MKSNKIDKTLLYKIGSILLLAMLVFACTTVPSVDFAHLGNPSDKVPLTNSALTGTLPNGLRYFILENQRPENRAHIALVVNAGSVLERDDQRGFAHFVEHMAFKGTARFPEMELIDYLRSLGMRFGPDLNAYVSFNETVYHFEVPVETVDGIRRIPDTALAILDDWSHAISFHPEDVDSERLVVLEEIRFRAGAMTRVWNIILPILYAGSPFEDRHPIGLAEIIETATAEQLREFYERWYTSDNIALIFVGDFDGKALQASLADHFNMPAATQPVNRPVFELPPPRRGNFQVEIITDPELTATQFFIFYKQPLTAQRGTLANFRQDIIDSLIQNMLSRRFEEAMTNPDAAAISSWGQVWRSAANTQFYYLGTSPKSGRAEDALRELLLEKESIRRFGFTESELERAKLNLISSLERQVSEKDTRDSRFFTRRFTSHFLFGEAVPDIEWELDAVLALLPGIGNREIAQAARNYFAHNDIKVFLIAPQAEADSLPSPQRIRAIFREAERARISPRLSETFTGDLLDRMPEPGIIINEEYDRETGSVILTLNNGTRVILRETANRNNEVIMYAMARGGTANVPEEEFISASLAGEMIAVSGLGPYSRIELVNRLAGKQVSMSFWASRFTRGFQGSSTINDLKTLFEMLHLFFTYPNFDERAIAAMLEQYRTVLAHQQEDPQRYFAGEITRIMHSNHPMFMPLEADDINRVCLEQAFSFIQKSINPSDYTFVFTGNLDMDKMRNFVSVYLASIPNAPSMTAWVDPGIIRPGQIQRNIFRGQDERCIVHLEWIVPGSAAFDEQKNQTAALLAEYLRIMLNDEIRERLSGVYAISAGASVSTIPTGEYSIRVRFQCDPARAEELIQAVKVQINNVFTQPLNMETFNMAREALLMQHESAIQRNLHIAQSFANSAALFDTPLGRLNRRPAAIKAVRPEDVQALSRIIAASGPMQMVLFPEAWQ